MFVYQGSMLGSRQDFFGEKEIKLPVQQYRSVEFCFWRSGLVCRLWGKHEWTYDNIRWRTERQREREEKGRHTDFYNTIGVSHQN